MLYLVSDIHKHHEAFMKPIMSDELREIIKDPKKNEELKKGLSIPLSDEPNKNKIVIGGRTYRVKLVNRTPR